MPEQQAVKTERRWLYWVRWSEDQAGRLFHLKSCHTKGEADELIAYLTPLPGVYNVTVTKERRP